MAQPLQRIPCPLPHLPRDPLLTLPASPAQTDKERDRSERSQVPAHATRMGSRAERRMGLHGPCMQDCPCPLLHPAHMRCAVAMLHAVCQPIGSYLQLLLKCSGLTNLHGGLTMAAQPAAAAPAPPSLPSSRRA